VKAAYLEMVGGASGNMILGAMIDAGLDPAAIESQLRTIPVNEPWELVQSRVVKRGIAATHVDFTIEGGDHSHRSLAEILDVLERSQLSASQRARAHAIYVRLADAEAKVHGSTRDQVAFHEVGAVDAILDVAAACIGLEMLGIERVYASEYPLGTGSITMHHGIYPNPPPATAELMRGGKTRSVDLAAEMVTTTGAAIVSSVVEHVGVRPSMEIDRLGYGAGTSDFPFPNVLRITIGEVDTSVESTRDRVVVLEANVDDLSPQYFELAFERVFAAGAFDAWLAPVTMKKSRPAIIFGVLAPHEHADACARVMLEQTSTLGVRRRVDERYTLARRIESRETPHGPVAVKIAKLNGGERETLEYDDVARIARSTGRPLAEIVRELQAHLRP